MSSIEQSLDAMNHCFVRSEGLGYLTVSPARLGGGLQVTVLLNIPLLSGRPGFQETCRRLGLTVRSACTAEARASDGHCALWEATNLDHFHLSEPEVVNIVIASCRKLVSMEDALRAAALSSDLCSTPAGSGLGGARSLRPGNSTGPRFDRAPRDVEESRDIRQYENYCRTPSKAKTARPKSSPGCRGNNHRIFAWSSLGVQYRANSNSTFNSNATYSSQSGGADQRNYNYFNDSEFLRRSIQAKTSRMAAQGRQ